MSQIESEELKDDISTYSITGAKRTRSPTSELPQEPLNKRFKSAHWNAIFAPKQSTSSSEKSIKKKTPSTLQLPKIVKNKLVKKVEEQFMNLPISKKQLLLNPAIQQDPSQFKTMAIMCNFEQSELQILKGILESHFSDISIQDKDTQSLMFNKVAPSHYPRPLKQQWNTASITVLAAQKRFALTQIYAAKLSNKLMKSITDITNVQLTAMRQISRVKAVLKLPSIKKKDNKLCSIDEELKRIQLTANTSRGKNGLCDSLLQMKHLIEICLNILTNEIHNINLLLIKLKICIFENEKRIQLKDKTINGHYVFRGSGLVTLFDKISQQINELKNKMNSKKQKFESIIKGKKVNKLQSRAEKMRKAKEADAKRKKERVEKENIINGNATSGMQFEESDDEP